MVDKGKQNSPGHMTSIPTHTGVLDHNTLRGLHTRPHTRLHQETQAIASTHQSRVK